MSEQLSPEAWHPPFKSTPQLVGDLVERFAVNLEEENADYVSHSSTYPLTSDGLGLVSIGETDVTFVKMASLGADRGVESNSYDIYVGRGFDVVFSIKTYDDDPNIYGGYGDLGSSGEQTVSDEGVRHFITDLTAEMWLHEMGLATEVIDEEIAIRSVANIVKSLARNPASPDYPEEGLCDTYAIDPGRTVWVALRAERWEPEEETIIDKLSLVNDHDEAIEVVVDERAGELVVSNFAGSQIEGGEKARRMHIMLSVLAKAISEGKIPTVAPANPQTDLQK